MRECRPCLVLVNGDLAWADGRREDYERFLGIMHPLATRAALVLTPGNHDRHDTLLACIAQRAGPAPQWVAAVVEQPPFRLVALDSSIDTGTVGGEIGGAQIAWLEALLASAPDAKTVIFVHHPGQSSSEGCADFQDLADLAQRQHCIQAIVTGHDHEYGLGRVGAVHHLRLPAVGFPFQGGIPTGWVEAAPASAGIDLRLRGALAPSLAHLPWR